MPFTIPINEVRRRLHLPFPFTSGEISKPRPALVLFDLGVDVVICRITSVQHAGLLDVPVSDWTAAGLIKPSVVRLNRLVTAEKSLLRTRLGELSDADKESVRLAWNSNMTL
jgi:mRNA-degrading endonuclease toxin of MazEF toxin-antitoxin module